MASQRLFVAFLSLALGLMAGSAQALDFSLTGGGGQFHIGNGLMLPIQQAAITTVTTGTVFPSLLVPVKAGPAPIITGTVAKPLLTTGGGKQGYQRRLHIPAGVLSKPAVQTTVGVFFSNTSLFAVGTNLNYVWPAAPATFSTGAAIGTTTVSAFGGSMTYSNALGSRFGGPASFLLAGGAGAGLVTSQPISIHIRINGTSPPCTHPAAFFGNGADIDCVVGVIFARPTGLAGQGGPTATTVMTPGAVQPPVETTAAGVPGTTPANNVALVKLGTSPSGTLLPGIAPPVTVKPYAFLAANAPLPTNMATSQPGPWTTGQIIITNMAAVPSETFTLTGKDARTAGGGGTIQLVSGALSNRATTGPNANRGWISLTLSPIAGVPSMSVLGLATTGALMLLTAGYAMRRRIFA